MELNLELSGRRVLVVAGARAGRQAIARYVAAGATVFIASEQADPAPRGVRLAEFPETVSDWRALVSAVDVVVVVEISRDADRLLERAIRDSRTWIMREEPAATSPIGHVTLVGGGPGGDLITLAGLRALARADVVFYDRLAPYDRLGEWAPGAEHVNVGKSPGHHAVPQAEIERMLVQAALEGRTVVRLKGGDPFVFGRGGEEVIACREAGVPVTVVPGVSSAVAVPAAAGIPVTHREVSHLFTVVSGHAPLSEEELAHLVGLGGTIVVLMGVGTLPHLSAGLARHGMKADMPVAVVERGYSAGQRTTIASLGDIVTVASEVGARSPAVLVVGEVVRLSQSDDASAAEFIHDTVALATKR